MRDLVFPHSPLGESLPEGPERGGLPRTLRVGFAEEPWANAQRLIWSVAELARVWRTSSFPHSPLGESLPEGPERGSLPRTLRVSFAGEPWANAQRLIWSVAELARVWRNEETGKSARPTTTNTTKLVLPAALLVLTLGPRVDRAKVGVVEG